MGDGSLQKDKKTLILHTQSYSKIENLIFLNETGFNEHTKRTYGYSLENHKAYITVPANRNVNKSLLCTLGINDVISFEYKNGSFNSNTFIDFIINKLVPYFRTNPTSIPVMDNARFHKSNEVTNSLRENNITFKFLTPYSPE